MAGFHFKHKHKVYVKSTLLRRILVFILTLLLGMAILVGAVAGGIYMALTAVSLNSLERVGVSVPNEILTEDSILRELSVLGLIGELSGIPGRLSSLSINTLLSEYGVILPDEVRAVIPAALCDLPLSELTGSGALDVILENVTMGEVFGSVGEQNLPALAWEKLSTRSLSHLARGEYYILFDGLYLGDFLGIPLTVAPDGTAEPDFSGGQAVSITAYLGTVNLGEYFAAEDGSTVIQASLDRTPLDSFVEADEGNPIAGAIQKKKLGDLLKLTNGGFTFSADNLMEDLYLGDTLSYEKGEDGIWYDADGKEATGVFRELAGLPLNNLTGDDIMDAVDRVYLAELMGYDRKEDGTDENGNPKYVFEKIENGVTKTPEGMIAEFADMTVGQLTTDGELDKTVKEMQVGVAMGYTLKDGVWYEADGTTRVSGAFRPLLGETVGNLDAGLDTLFLGEVMGFDAIYEAGSETPIFRKDENGNGDYTDDGDNKPGPLMEKFVDMTLADIDDESQFTDRIQEVRIGDAMGYTLKEGVWYNGDDPVTGMFRTLAGKRVDELEEAVKNVSVADALGYEYKDGKWVSTDGKNTEPPGILRVLMTSTLAKLPGDARNVYVGEIMGYEKYDRDPDPDKEDIGFRRPNPDKKEDSDPDYLYPQGAVAEFADMTVSELEKEGKITEKIEGMKVGIAMGYTPVYDADGNITSWLDNTLDKNPVTNSLLKTVIDKKVGEIGKVMDDLTLGEAMGYTYSGTCEWGEACDHKGDRCEHLTWSDAGGGENTGYAKIIGPETRIKDLNDKLTEIKDVSIGRLMEAKVLDLDDQETRLNKIFGNSDVWKTYSFDTFVEEIIKKFDELEGLTGGASS